MNNKLVLVALLGLASSSAVFAEEAQVADEAAVVVPAEEEVAAEEVPAE